MFSIPLTRLETTGRQATPYTTSLTELYLATDTWYQFLLAGLQAGCHDGTDASVSMVITWRHDVHNLLLTYCLLVITWRHEVHNLLLTYCLLVITWIHDVHNLLLTYSLFLEIRINFSALKCLYCFFKFVSLIKILYTFLNKMGHSQTDRHVEYFHIYLAFIIFCIAWISSTFLPRCFISFLTYIV